LLYRRISEEQARIRRFVEELPSVNSHGRTIEEARENLQRLAVVAFDEERAQSAELLTGKDVVREQFSVSIPKAIVL